MNITEMIISAVLKKGILYESENVNIEIHIPEKSPGGEPTENKTKIFFTATNMSLRIERKDES